MKTTRLFAFSFLSLSLLTSASWAQGEAKKEKEEPKRERPSAANIEEYRKKAAEKMKGMLNATDEEWTVLQPLIENVMNRQRDAYAGRTRGFGFGGPGGGGPGGGGSSSNEPPRPGQLEAQSLQSALESDATSVDEIKSKLSALRDAHKRAQAALSQARDELRKVLTVRQEAALVTAGLLE